MAQLPLLNAQTGTTYTRGGTVPYGGASPNGGAQQDTREANGNPPGGGGCGAMGLGADGRVRFEW